MWRGHATGLVLTAGRGLLCPNLVSALVGNWNVKGPVTGPGLMVDREDDAGRSRAGFVRQQFRLVWQCVGSRFLHARSRTYTTRDCM